MLSFPPPVDVLAVHTFGRNHFSPPPLPERLERIERIERTPGVATEPGLTESAPVPDLDQRIRDVGEW